jgi:hypothetical protein
LPEGGQEVPAGGVLDVGQELGALAHEVAAAAEEVPGRAHLAGVDVGHRQHPAPQQHGNLVGIDLVVLGFAPVDCLHIEGVTQDEGDPLLRAEVGNPVPGEDALDRYHQVLAVCREGGEEVLRSGRAIAVDAHLALGIQHTDVHPSGVQIDPTIVSSRCVASPMRDDRCSPQRGAGHGSRAVPTHRETSRGMSPSPHDPFLI